VEDDEVMDNYNPVPQTTPGASAAVGHNLDNSIPLSIFPIAVDKFCICFCGLPGRGKTHVSRRLERYLKFFHAMPVEIFNVGEFRRKTMADDCTNSAEFFDPTNATAMERRNDAFECVTRQMVEFLTSNTSAVAIHDSTNFSHERRMRLLRAVNTL
jgi:tRNA uridine 5-carbamoylmethylation protein Kti12